MAPLSEFDRALRPHLAAAYNLARWLTRTEANAEDVLQDAALRAFRFFEKSPPANPKAWLLRIVRNCCFDLREHRRPEAQNQNSYHRSNPAIAMIHQKGYKRGFSGNSRNP